VLTQPAVCYAAERSAALLAQSQGAQDTQATLQIISTLSAYLQGSGGQSGGTGNVHCNGTGNSTRSRDATDVSAPTRGFYH
jgi:hypothetical protein